MIKSIKDKTPFLQVAEDCLERDYKLAETIINEVVDSVAGDANWVNGFKEAYTLLMGRMIRLFSGRDNEKDLMLMNKLFKNCKVETEHSQEYVRMFLRSKHKTRLHFQFFTLPLTKQP